MMLLPKSQAELTRYFEGFAKKLKESLGHSPAILAEKLGRISYGEAEQFCLDIRRRSVLALGEKSLKAVASIDKAAVSADEVVALVAEGLRKEALRVPESSKHQAEVLGEGVDAVGQGLAVTAQAAVLMESK